MLCSLVSLVGNRERIADAVDFVPPVSFRPFSMETSGPPKSPSYPLVCVPRSKTPVVSSRLAIAPSRTVAFRCVEYVGFPSYILEVILLTTTIPISGFNNTARILAPPSFNTFPHENAPGLRYRPAGSALVGWDLRRFDSHPLDNNDRFRRIAPIPAASDLSWRYDAMVGIYQAGALVSFF